MRTHEAQRMTELACRSGNWRCNTPIIPLASRLRCFALRPTPSIEPRPPRYIASALLAHQPWTERG